MDTLDRYEIEVPEEAGPMLRSYINRAVVGQAAALPMICRGTDCPYLQHCWLYKIRKETGKKIKLPVGKPCPQEVAVLEAVISKLADMLGLKKGDPGAMEQYELIYELAANELLRTRTAFYLSDNPELFTERIVGYSNSGQPIFDVRTNPALAANERLSRLIAKLREQLLVTPETQAKAGKTLLDPSNKAANLRQRLMDLLESRGMKEADYEVEDDSD